MVSPNWHNELLAALRREQLPQAYIVRLSDELCAHFDDLLQETSGMDAPLSEIAHRLGTPEQLAQAAAEEFRRRSLVHRHPLCVFGLLPVPALLLSWIGLGATNFLIGTLAGDVDGPLTWDDAQLINAIATFELLLPIPGLMAIFTQLAYRQGMAMRWSLLSTGVLALLAGVCMTSASLNPETQRPVLLLIAGLPLRIQQWAQIAGMLVIGLWLCRRPGLRPLCAE